jgi:hypothetical protein
MSSPEPELAAAVAQAVAAVQRAIQPDLILLRAALLLHLTVRTSPEDEVPAEVVAEARAQAADQIVARVEQVILSGIDRWLSGQVAEIVGEVVRQEVQTARDQSEAALAEFARPHVLSTWFR